MPHTIRLRGPWDYLPLERQHGSTPPDVMDLPPGGRTTVPGDWSGDLEADFCGMVRYTRRFNCPTNLAPTDHVWVVFEGVDHQATIELNGRALGTAQGWRSMHRFEITSVLEPSNLLQVDVRLPAAVFTDAQARPGRAGQAGGIIGEVRLEIDG